MSSLEVYTSCGRRLLVRHRGDLLEYRAGRWAPTLLSSSASRRIALFALSSEFRRGPLFVDLSLVPLPAPKRAILALTVLFDFFLEVFVRVIGVDSETHLIKPGLLAPRLVCVSWAESSGKTGLVLRPEGIELAREWLVDPDVVVAIVNAPYDLGVLAAEDPSLLPLIFDAYGAARICDLITLQKLIDVALGMRKFRRYRGKIVKSGYSLDDLADLYFDERVEKVDTWRLRYALLDGVPVAEWPEEARSYAISDAVWHLRLYEAMQREIGELFRGDLPNQVEAQRSGWALHLMSMWGIRADEASVDRFVDHCRSEIEKMHAALYSCQVCGVPPHQHVSSHEPETSGIFRWDRAKKKPARVMAEIRRRVALACARQGVDVPMTDPSLKFPDGQVKTETDLLLETDDPKLHVLASSLTFEKHLGQWEGPLRAAVLRPVCCRYDNMQETGRTASSGSEGQEGTNIQNPPRKGDVRPAIRPRDGWVFCSTDADVIELCAHAQNCLELVGWSQTAEVLRAYRAGGPDPHVVLGARLMDVDVEEAWRRYLDGDPQVGDARQFAKIPQYGLIGGLGAETFVGYAAGQLDRADFERWLGANRIDAVKKAKWVKQVWLETYPENKEYFRVVGDMTRGGEATIRQLMSGRIRGGVRFTAATNGFMQGRVADAMKEILWRLAYECYTGRCSTCKGAAGRAKRPEDQDDGARGPCGDCVGTGKSILYGSRPVMFLHDEPIVEHSEDGTESARADRQVAIMESTLNKWMPSVPCTSSAVLMRRWYKGAKPVRAGGLLVPSRPEKYAEGGKEKVRWVYDDGEQRRAA